MAKAAKNDELKKALEASVKGTQDGMAAMEKLAKAHGEDPSGEHCKGMEGLVKEAKKHAIDEKIEDQDVRDVVIISQFQRMSHYGICGFGTCKAFAEALEKSDHVKQLDEITADIYGADENMTDLAERSVNLKAKKAA